MAGSINKVILVGNLGQDPRVSNTQSGAKVVSFSLATTDTWRDKVSGERKDRTEWHRIVIFSTGLADTAERYLRKGSKVYLEGSVLRPVRAIFTTLRRLRDGTIRLLPELT